MLDLNVQNQNECYLFIDGTSDHAMQKTEYRSHSHCSVFVKVFIPIHTLTEVFEMDINKTGLYQKFVNGGKGYNFCKQVS